MIDNQDLAVYDSLFSDCYDKLSRPKATYG